MAPAQHQARHGARSADRAIDAIRVRFGHEAVDYDSGALGLSRSVPDALACRKGALTGRGDGQHGRSGRPRREQLLLHPASH